MSSTPRPVVLAAIAITGALLLWAVTRDDAPIAPRIAPATPVADDPHAPTLLPIDAGSSAATAAGSPGPEATGPGAPRPRRGVFGHVRCADGSPAGNATVTAHHLSEELGPAATLVPVHPLAHARDAGVTRTDSTGAFAFDGLAPGPYRVSARHARGHALSAQCFVAPTHATGPIELSLIDTVRLVGRVVGPAGDPVARAELQLLASNQQPAAPQRVRAAANGRFELEVAPGRHCVRVAAPGFVPQLYFDLPAPADDVQIALTTGGRITGTVVAREDSRPLPGARIDAQCGDWHEQATASANGGFHLDAAPSGEILLQVQAHERAPQQRLVRVAAGGEATIDIALALGMALNGSLVEDRGGLPLAGAWVIAHPLESGSGPATRCQTDEDGRFRLVGLGRGAHRVWVASDGHALPAALEVFLDPALPRPSLELRARPIARVEGRLVVPAGEETAGVPVRITARAPSPWLDRGAVADAAGRFTLPVAVLGEELDLEVDHPRLGRTYFGPLRLAAGEVLRVEVPLLAGARVGGTVRGGGGAPIAGAILTLLAQGESVDALDERAHAASALNGAWSIAGVARGARWVLRAEARGHATWYSEAFEVQGTQDIAMDINLTTAAALAGRVYDRVGSVVGAGVEAADAVTRRFLGRATSGADGAYELGGLPDGPYLISVYANGRAAITREVHAAGAGCDFELARECSITIEIELPEGYPLDYYLRAYADGDGGAAPVAELQSSPRHTSHTLGPLAEGRYRVLLDGAGLVPVERAGIEATEEGGLVLRVALERGQLAVGLVTDEVSGAPIHGAAILRGRQPATLTEQAALEQRLVIESTHPDGSYHVTGFGPEPRAWITIVHEGYRTRHVEIDVGASAVQQIRLARGLELGVRVVGTGVVSGRSIRIEGPVAREGTSDESGRAQFAGLEPGRYVARLDGRAEALEFVLPRDRELELPLE